MSDAIASTNVAARPPAPETTERFHSLDAVRAFAGENYETAVVPPAARKILSHFDATSAHYEVLDRRSY